MIAPPQSAPHKKSSAFFRETSNLEKRRTLEKSKTSKKKF